MVLQNFTYLSVGLYQHREIDHDLQVLICDHYEEVNVLVSLLVSSVIKGDVRVPTLKEIFHNFIDQHLIGGKRGIKDDQEDCDSLYDCVTVVLSEETKDTLGGEGQVDKGVDVGLQDLNSYPGGV